MKSISFGVLYKFTSTITFIYWKSSSVIFLLSGHVMRLQSSGRQGDQVTLTSVLYVFPKPVSIYVDFRSEESKPGTRSEISVYVLSKHRVPARVPRFAEFGSQVGWTEGWKRGCARIPRGTYHVMFLVTLGTPYYSDVYLDKIQFGNPYDCGSIVRTPTGSFTVLFLSHKLLGIRINNAVLNWI